MKISPVAASILSLSFSEVSAKDQRVEALDTKSNNSLRGRHEASAVQADRILSSDGPSVAAEVDALDQDLLWNSGNREDRGEWEEPPVEEVAGGYYGCGAQIQYSYSERDEELWAIGIHVQLCHLDDWYDQIVFSAGGNSPFSSNHNPELVQGALTMCPEKSLIKGSRVREDPERRGGDLHDNMIFFGLQLLCEDPESLDREWITVMDETSASERQGATPKDWADSVTYNVGRYVKAAAVKYSEEEFAAGRYRAGMVGLRFAVDYLHYEPSVLYDINALPIRGYWSRVGSATDATISSIISVTKTADSEFTTEKTEGWSTEMARGVNFGIDGVFEASFEKALTEGGSGTVSRAMTQSLETTEERTFTVRCYDSDLTSTGVWHVWQWTMEQAHGKYDGFLSQSMHFTCTESASLPPLCPVGFCADIGCQNCLAPYESFSAGATASPTVPPTPAPTPASSMAPTLPTTSVIGRVAQLRILSAVDSPSELWEVSGGSIELPYGVNGSTKTISSDQITLKNLDGQLCEPTNTPLSTSNGFYWCDLYFDGAKDGADFCLQDGDDSSIYKYDFNDLEIGVAGGANPSWSFSYSEPSVSTNMGGLNSISERRYFTRSGATGRKGRIFMQYFAVEGTCEDYFAQKEAW